MATRIQALRGQSSAARLRPLMPEIDRQIRAGVAQRDILALLHADGIDITLETFRTYLKRYRQKVRQGKTAPVEPAVQEKTTDHTVAVETRKDDQDKNLEDVLDRARRDEIGDEYLIQRPPLFKGKKKSGSTE